MPADVFDVGEQIFFLEERATMDGACFQVEAWQAIDVVLDVIERRSREGGCVVCEGHAFDVGQRFFEHASLSASGCLDLPLQFLFEVGGWVFSSDNDGLEVGVVFDFGDGVVGVEEVLIFEKSDGEILRIVSDGHLRDDFAAVEVDGEGFFFDDGKREGVVVMVGTGEATREVRAVGGGEKGQGQGHEKSVADCQKARAHT